MQLKSVFAQLTTIALALITVSVTPMAASATIDPACAATITRGGIAASESDVPIAVSGIYCVASFNTVANNYSFTVPAGITKVDYLVVGGGGGGASGGGGAGGVLQATGYTVTPGAAIAIEVGAGGAGGNGGGAPGGKIHGTKGSNSKFGSITALGGGGGSSLQAGSPYTNADGGSGGGSSYDCTSSACYSSYGPAGSGTAGQGNNGGYSTYNSYGAGGGGGGAGGAGFNTTRLYVGANGGVGVSSDITGSTTWYGGGGGGGVNNNDNKFVDSTGSLFVAIQTTGGGQGGQGGGGRGSSYGYTSATTLGANANATAGAANTGGGGGGTDPEDINGASGGSGVVIVRWVSDVNLKTITFNSNTTAATTATQKVGANLATALNPNSFSKTGWVFSGWTTNSDGTGTSYADGESITTATDVTLYAKWLPGVTHTVTFDANQGTGSMSNQVSGTTTNLTANAFTRANYTFAGWNTAADGTGFAYPNTASYSFSEDTTMYAQWEQIVASYKVTFYGNGATGGATNMQVASTTTQLNMNGFTKTGYNFLGWNATFNAGTATYIDGQNYAFTSDISLYAQWVAESNNTITYDSNGSVGAPTSGTMADQIASSRTLITANSFTRAGYTFRNWNTAANGTGVTYQSNYSYNFATSRTLYAQWGANITVSYDANTAGSGSAPISQSSYNGSPGINLSLNTGNLVKTGYRLAGWNTLADGTGTPYALGASSIKFTTDKVLYAHWTPAIYSVIYSGNGSTAGTEPTAQTFQYGSTVNVSDNTGALVKTGFTFSGWNTSADGSGSTYTAAQASVSLSADTVMFAKWAQVQVQNNSGGQSPVVTPVTPPIVTSPAKTAISLTVSGFAGGSSLLTSAMKSKIKSFVLKNSDYMKMSVTGYTEGPKILKMDYVLSRARAKNVASFIGAVLKPSVKITSLFSKQETVKAPNLRRVKITLSN